MPELYQIDHRENGLRGFVRDLGGDLEKSLVKDFERKIEKHQINVRWADDKPGNYFVLSWIYEGNHYRFSGEFSLMRNSSDDKTLTIDNFPGVGVYGNGNCAMPRASPKELITAAEMEVTVARFLNVKFGDSVGKRRNGCPLYKGTIPEKYLPNPLAA